MAGEWSAMEALSKLFPDRSPSVSLSEDVGGISLIFTSRGEIDWKALRRKAAEAARAGKLFRSLDGVLSISETGEVPVSSDEVKAMPQEDLFWIHNILPADLEKPVSYQGQNYFLSDVYHCFRRGLIGMSIQSKEGRTVLSLRFPKGERRANDPELDVLDITGHLSGHGGPLNAFDDLVIMGFFHRILFDRLPLPIIDKWVGAVQPGTDPAGRREQLTQLLLSWTKELGFFSRFNEMSGIPTANHYKNLDKEKFLHWKRVLKEVHKIELSDDLQASKAIIRDIAQAKAKEAVELSDSLLRFFDQAPEEVLANPEWKDTKDEMEAMVRKWRRFFISMYLLLSPDLEKDLEPYLSGPVDLAQWFRQETENKAWDSKGKKFNVEFSSSLESIKVHWPLEWLHLALDRLMSNGYHAIEKEAKTLPDELEHVDLSLEEAGPGKVKIIIENPGRIPEEQLVRDGKTNLPKIFLLDPYRTDKSHGIGLPFAIQTFHKLAGPGAVKVENLVKIISGKEIGYTRFEILLPTDLRGMSARSEARDEQPDRSMDGQIQESYEYRRLRENLKNGVSAGFDMLSATDKVVPQHVIEVPLGRPPNAFGNLYVSYYENADQERQNIELSQQQGALDKEFQLIRMINYFSRDKETEAARDDLKESMALEYERANFVNRFTRSAIMGLQIADPKGEIVFVAGAGDGILAIAAAKLGARKVIVTDWSRNALALARKNIVNNGVEGKMVFKAAGDFRQTSLTEEEMPDIVIANLPLNHSNPSYPVFKDSLVLAGNAYPEHFEPLTEHKRWMFVEGAVAYSHYIIIPKVSEGVQWLDASAQIFQRTGGWQTLSLYPDGRIFGTEQEGGVFYDGKQFHFHRKPKDPQDVMPSDRAKKDPRSELRIGRLEVNPAKVVETARTKGVETVRSELRERGRAELEKSVDGRIAQLREELGRYGSSNEIVSFVLSSGFEERLTVLLGEFGDVPELVSRIRNRVVFGDEYLSFERLVDGASRLDIGKIARDQALLDAAASGLLMSGKEPSFILLMDRPGDGIAEEVLKMLTTLKPSRLIVYNAAKEKPFGRALQNQLKLPVMPVRKENEVRRAVRASSDLVVSFWTKDRGMDDLGIYSVLAEIGRIADPRLRELALTAVRIAILRFATLDKETQDKILAKPSTIRGYLEQFGIPAFIQFGSKGLIFDIERLGEEYTARQSVAQAA